MYVSRPAPVREPARPARESGSRGGYSDGVGVCLISFIVSASGREWSVAFTYEGKSENAFHGIFGDAKRKVRFPLRIIFMRLGA